MKSKAEREIIPARKGESDEEQRLREAINRHCGQLCASLDAAIRLRTASNEAKKARHQARNHLTEFALKAMYAQALNCSEQSETQGEKP
ncbi:MULTISPECIES: hypothetical protein [Halocynthiibacter]|uniref:Uncharacterized protein n=1 Tax=Halocynthiibacter halioticoli TaxID=2986804 RepID=A0AAE3J238_9RHOB|nr:MULTISPECIES: hypothetical protein [Halocynthiibacter]MCV6826009.1 hypothetical protein [Halocynthiibacter halioticoli]MCW4059010.1 hypothetical protein [Halocynthiibacter sp. SDUM655004]